MQKRNVLSALCAAFALCAASAFAAMPDEEFVQLCEKGATEQIRQALRDGANVEARDEAGWTALMHAAGSGAAATRVLLEAGANPNTVDPSGWSPLMVAKDGETVRALLAAGADVNGNSNERWTALMFAAGVEDKGGRLAALLAAGADVNAQSRDGETALMKAASGGQVEAARALLAAGADKTLADKAGHDALWYAKNPDREVSKEDAAACVKLLQGGAKKPAAQGAGAFSAADLKRMSTFVSNFVEVRFPDFDMQKGEAPPNSALIRFGIGHNLINNRESRIKFCPQESCTHGSWNIDAKFVAESVKKYFDLDVQHRSVSGDDGRSRFHFDGKSYHFEVSDFDSGGDAMPSHATVKRAVRDGDVIRMTGDIYYESNGEEKPDRDGSFVVTAKPHTWNGKKTWAILSLKREWR